MGDGRRNLRDASDLHVPASRWRLGVLLAPLLVVLAGGASFTGTASALSGPSFLAKALGSSVASAPLRQDAATRVAVTIDRAGFTVSRKGSAVSLAQEHAGAGRWDRFEHGVSRRTPFGHETIVVDRMKAEQFLTVDKHQGLKTWSWALQASNLRPRLRADGAVEFLAGGRLAPLLISPVDILGARGTSVTPAGLRWSLARQGSSWRLELRLDDSRLQLPYVIDPAIVFSTGAKA